MFDKDPRVCVYDLHGDYYFMIIFQNEETRENQSVGCQNLDLGNLGGHGCSKMKFRYQFIEGCA